MNAHWGRRAEGVRQIAIASWVVAAAGWHGIGELTPSARIGALLFVTVLVVLGGVLAARYNGPGLGGPDEH